MMTLASDVFFSHLYSAGVQEGLVVVVQSIFCVGRGCEANKRELPGFPFFGADDLCIRHLSRRPAATTEKVLPYFDAGRMAGVFAEIQTAVCTYQENTASLVHTSPIEVPVGPLSHGADRVDKNSRLRGEQQPLVGVCVVVWCTARHARLCSEKRRFCAFG